MKLFAAAPALLVLVSLCGTQVAASPGSISGVTFQDVNHNGIYDTCDYELRNAPVVATSADGERVSTTSDSRGNFTLEEVPVGDVRVTLQHKDPKYIWPVTTVAADGLPGLIVPVQTRTETAGVEVGSARDTAVDSNEVLVFGIIYEDENGNSQVDKNECGIPESSAYPNTSGAEGVINTDPPARDGTFEIRGMSAPSPVTVYPGGPNVAWEYTGPGDPSSPCNRGVRPVKKYGGNIYEVNIGFQRASISGSLGGVVFHDVNENGVRDDGEEPVGGVLLSVAPYQPTCGGPFPEPTVADGSGHFRFTRLPDGDYFVFASGPTGSETQIARPLDERPLERSIKNGSQETIDVPMRVVPAGVLHVRVFEDSNGDGVRGADEEYLDQVQVCAYQPGTEDNQITDTGIYPRPYYGGGYDPFYGTGGCMTPAPLDSTSVIGRLTFGDYVVSVTSQAFGGVSLAQTSVSINGTDVLDIELPVSVPQAPDLVLQAGDEVQTLAPDVCHSDPTFVQRPFEDGYDPTLPVYDSWGISESDARTIYERGIYFTGSVHGDAGGNIWRIISGEAWRAGVPEGCGKLPPTIDTINVTDRTVYVLVGYEVVEAVSQGAVLQMMLRSAPGAQAFVFNREFPAQYTLFVDESYNLITGYSMELAGYGTTGGGWFD